MSRRFYSFSASAVGFAAHLRRPKDVLIQSQAAAAIGTIGGLSSARVSACQFFKGNVCFEKASSTCEGDYRPSKEAEKFTNSNHSDNNLAALTRIAASVSGVQIVNAKEPKAPRQKLTVKKAAFQMEILDPRSGGQNEFTFNEFVLDNVAIDGCKLKFTFATDLFNEFKTQDALKTAWEGDPDFASRYGHLFEPCGANHSRKFPANGRGGTLATVVHKVEWANPKKTASDVEFLGANRIRIDGIGTLTFGELIITPNSRRISMVRMELGSQYGGDSECAYGEGAGNEYP